MKENNFCEGGFFYVMLINKFEVLHLKQCIQIKWIENDEFAIIDSLLWIKLTLSALFTYWTYSTVFFLPISLLF